MVDYGTDYSSTGLLEETGDIAVVSGYDNLKQRISNILLVPYDYYEDDFGSYLYQLLGKDLNDTNKKLIELYIKSYLKKDERIKDVIISKVDVNINRDVIINVSVQTYDDTEIDTTIEINNNGTINVEEEE